MSPSGPRRGRLRRWICPPEFARTVADGPHPAADPVPPPASNPPAIAGRQSRSAASTTFSKCLSGRRWPAPPTLHPYCPAVMGLRCMPPRGGSGAPRPPRMARLPVGSLQGLSCPCPCVPRARQRRNRRFVVGGIAGCVAVAGGGSDPRGFNLGKPGCIRPVCLDNGRGRCNLYRKQDRGQFKCADRELHDQRGWWTCEPTCRARRGGRLYRHPRFL